MTPEEKSAIQIVLSSIEEWHWEDRGADYNECWSCGWNTRKDRTPEVRLSHHAGCKLRAAMDLLEESVKEDE